MLQLHTQLCANDMSSSSSWLKTNSWEMKSSLTWDYNQQHLVQPVLTSTYIIMYYSCKHVRALVALEPKNNLARYSGRLKPSSAQFQLTCWQSIEFVMLICFYTFKYFIQMVTSVNCKERIIIGDTDFGMKSHLVEMFTYMSTTGSLAVQQHYESWPLVKPRALLHPSSNLVNAPGKLYISKNQTIQQAKRNCCTSQMPR
jgi:hypothetical protein